MKLIKSNLAIALAAAVALNGCGSGEDEETTAINIPEDTAPPSISIEQAKLLNEPADALLESSVRLSLSKAAKEEVTLSYEVTALTATAGVDFEISAGDITIPIGSLSSTISFNVLPDSFDEEDETFLISISDPKNATLKTGFTESIVTIRDTDPTPSAGFTTDVASVTEDTGLFSVELKVDTASGKEIQLPFMLSGLATESQDYNVLTESPVIVASGQTSGLIKFEILKDSVPEGGESIVIELLEPSNAVLSDENKLTVIVNGDLGMNDTGVTTWFDGTNFNATSPTSDYPSQDAEFGRDADDTVSFDGHSGFTLTKIDVSGNALPSNAQSYESVLDNQTGLFWEIKSNAQTLPTISANELRNYITEAIREGNYDYWSAHRHWRASNYTYYWYNTNTKTNGGANGATGNSFIDTQYPISMLCAAPDETLTSYNTQFRYCNTDNYLNQLNATSVSGFKDWRLPTISELQSIHNFAVDAADSLSTYFPNQPTGQLLSSTPVADAEGAVWCLDTETGQAKFCNKNIPYHIRAVRGGAQ
ncbi:MAG: hypothetical protein CMK62_00695 [Pseudoalteromonadaceae bacterium]|nr:hypothetical protein [Pseudoalteromonadaceae bacterium]